MPELQVVYGRSAGRNAAADAFMSIVDTLNGRGLHAFKLRAWRHGWTLSIWGGPTFEGSCLSDVLSELKKFDATVPAKKKGRRRHG